MYPTFTSQQVTLNPAVSDAGSGVAGMQFSNDGVNFSAAESYATAKTWRLSDGYGTKTVYAKWTDTAGNSSSETISGSITYYNLIPSGNLDAAYVRTLTADETWAADYTLYGRVIVPEGIHLTIGAGVKVTVTGPADADPYQDLQRG